jgi:hypothetical protein
MPLPNVWHPVIFSPWPRGSPFDNFLQILILIRKMYRKTQFFNPAYELGETIEFVVGGAALSLITFFLTGHARISLFSALVVTFITLGLHWCNFYKLTVMVDHRRVLVLYGVGFIRREYPIRNIESCEPVSNTTSGNRWSIPWGPLAVWPIEKPFSFSDRLIVLPMRSREAIRIRTKDGETILIGTRESKQMSKIINEVMANMKKYVIA